MEHGVVHPLEWQTGTGVGIVRRRVAAIASLKARVQEVGRACGRAIHDEAVPMLHGCVCVEKHEHRGDDMLQRLECRICTLRAITCGGRDMLPCIGIQVQDHHEAVGQSQRR